jgi:hypothetical protein
MLDQEAWAIAEDRIRAEVAHREPLVVDELVKAQGNAVKAGALHSSGMAAAIVDICAKEVEVETVQAWTIVHGLIQETKTSPSNDDVEQLSSGFDRLFRTYCYARQMSRIDETCQRLGIQQSWIRYQDFEGRALNARSRVASQIKEFVWSRRKAAEAEPPFGTGEFWWYVLNQAWEESEFKQPLKVLAAVVAALASLLFKGQRDWHSLGFAAVAATGVFIVVNLFTFAAKVLSIPPKLANRRARRDGR